MPDANDRSADPTSDPPPAEPNEYGDPADWVEIDSGTHVFPGQVVPPEPEPPPRCEPSDDHLHADAAELFANFGFDPDDPANQPEPPPEGTPVERIAAMLQFAAEGKLAAALALAQPAKEPAAAPPHNPHDPLS